MTAVYPGSNAEISRRTVLTAAGGAAASVALAGMATQADAAQARPKRGGTLRFATRLDVSGLDTHRNVVYPVSMPLAAITQGLLDLNLQSEPAPGVASEWGASPDLMTYTFKLRRGVLFHNGREVDAAAVKWNFERIQNPKTSHAFHRSALKNLKAVVAVDKYTVRCELHQPSAAFPANVVYYPCNLMAPDSEAQADTQPIGCGPFKLVKWERYQVTELERFENYFETDAAGNPLPYLDRLVGLPKSADEVRMTALRTGEVDLIDRVSRAHAPNFASTYGERLQSWTVPQLGTGYVAFNLAKGPFQDKRLRQAAAHAIDREAILRAVSYGLGQVATGYYATVSPWHVSGAKPPPEYDPEKSRFLLRQARSEGVEVMLQTRNAPQHFPETGEMIQAMLTEVGFKVAYNVYDWAVYGKKIRAGEFHVTNSGGSYRFDPDGWYSRQVLSSAPLTRRIGFRHDKADKLIHEARGTVGKRKRLALYAEVDSIINDELPYLYTINASMLQGGSMRLKGHQPALSGPFTTAGGGIRTAWLA